MSAKLVGTIGGIGGLGALGLLVRKERKREKKQRDAKRIQDELNDVRQAIIDETNEKVDSVLLNRQVLNNYAATTSLLPGHRFDVVYKDHEFKKEIEAQLKGAAWNIVKKHIQAMQVQGLAEKEKNEFKTTINDEMEELVQTDIDSCLKNEVDKKQQKIEHAKKRRS